jgi:hypothetical protein
VQAVALLGGGAADFRIVGREQQSPDSDEIAGRRPKRAVIGLCAGFRNPWCCRSLGVAGALSAPGAQDREGPPTGSAPAWPSRSELARAVPNNPGRRERQHTADR